MRPPRFTIANLMATVSLAAILLAVFRFGSFRGLVALLPLGVTALISRLGSSQSERRYALGLGVAGTLLLPFLAAIWINHLMWGYYVTRPGLDRRIALARQIESVTRVETRSDLSGHREFFGVPVVDVDGFIQVHPQEGDYYVLEGRVLRALKDRQILPPEAQEMPSSRLRGLYQVLNESGRLEDGEPGYDHAKELSGIVVEAIGRDGRPLLFVGVRGGEVSNDHHPYYEFVFTRDSAAGHLKLVSTQHFYYDLAGIEGLEWPVFLPVLTIASLIPTLTTQGFLLWRGRRRRMRLGDTTQLTESGSR
jgi:hypothetical protein